MTNHSGTKFSYYYYTNDMQLCLLTTTKWLNKSQFDFWVFGTESYQENKAKLIVTAGQHSKSIF